MVGELYVLHRALCPRTQRRQCRVGWDKSFGLMPYGERWRLHRKMFNQHFRAALIPEYHQKMLQEARTLVDLIEDTPDDFFKHIR